MATKIAKRWQTPWYSKVSPSGPHLFINKSWVQATYMVCSSKLRLSIHLLNSRSMNIKTLKYSKLKVPTKALKIVNKTTERKWEIKVNRLSIYTPSVEIAYFLVVLGYKVSFPWMFSSLSFSLHRVRWPACDRARQCRGFSILSPCMYSFQVWLEFNLFDGESCGKLFNSILGTQG